MHWIASCELNYVNLNLSLILSSPFLIEGDKHNIVPKSLGFF